MEKIKNFFANKRIGYYLVILDVILAIFVGIFFFATYKHFEPGYQHMGMAASAYANVPEVIGLFLILGAIVDIVALVSPEYILIHLAAIGAYCVSFMKQIFCIPNLVADEINNVHYQGGSFPLCLSWLIITLVILISAIVVMFIGMIKQEEEDAKMREKPVGKKLIRVVASGATIIVAFAVIMTVYGITDANIKKGIAANKETTLAERVKERLKTFEDKVVSYDFDPSSVKFTEEGNPYSSETASTVNSKISDWSENQERQDEDGNELHKVYVFEGATAEGWQGDYSLKICRITLWEDGLYNGQNTNGGSVVDRLKGYWYNVGEAGEECLVLISTSNEYNMVGNKITGASSYYEWFVDCHANYNTQQGGRYIKANGLKYHPLIGMFVDTGSKKTPEFKVNSLFDISEWTCMQVRNNLIAGSIFDAEHQVTWTYRAKDAAESDPWTNAPDMTKTGTVIAKARWNVDKFAQNVQYAESDTTQSNPYYEVEVEFNIVDEQLAIPHTIPGASSVPGFCMVAFIILFI